MKNEIFENFYHRMLPLYQPQAEKLIQTTDPAIFSEISFRYTFTVEAMTKVSHIIENAAMANPGVVDLHVSFQKLSRVLPQRARYVQLAQSVRGLWLYGAPDLAPAEIDFGPRDLAIDTGDSLLADYWFVVAYGPGIGMSLLAEEIAALDGSDRYYEGFYTFEQDVAYQIINMLHRIYPERVPRPVPPEQFTD